MDPKAHDDRTRDITLPPLPDRPPPALPEEWAGLRTPVDGPTTALPAPARPPGEPARRPLVQETPIAEPVEQLEEVDPVAEEERRVAGRRTDQLVQVPRPARERTLAFSSPEMRHRSIEPVQVGSKPRRWPWVVLTLLPVLVIVGFGVAWLILLRGM